MPRDPRTDPRPGDVLRRRSGVSHFIVAADRVWVLFLEGADEHVRAMPRSYFDTWARDVEVIHVAQEDGT